MELSPKDATYPFRPARAVSFVDILLPVFDPAFKQGDFIPALDRVFVELSTQSVAITPELVHGDTSDAEGFKVVFEVVVQDKIVEEKG